MLSNRLRMVASEKKPPQIVGIESASGSAATLDVPIPDGDEGDLLLLIMGVRGASFAEPIGWNEDVSLSFGAGSGRVALQTFIREADGTEGEVVSLERGISLYASSGIIYRFRRWSVPGYPNAYQSRCNSPLPTVEATAPSVVICAVARTGHFSALQTVPAGYAVDMVETSSNSRFVAISNPSVPKGLVSPGALTYASDIDCLALTYEIPGK